jgi:hypothetical protein
MIPAPVAAPVEDDKQDACPGRLTVSCLRGRNIGPRGPQAARQQVEIKPYFKFMLNSKKRGRKVKPVMEQKTAESKEKMGKLPDFKGATVRWNLFNPDDLRTIDGKLPPLRIELYDKKAWTDTLLGFAELPLGRFFEGGMKTIWVPLLVHEVHGKRVMEMPTEAGEVELMIKFEPARKGMLIITTYEARDLPNVELFGKQDPYVKISVGKDKKKGKTINNGGQNPYFQEEELEFYIGEREWKDDLKIELYDADIGRDDLISSTIISIMPIINQTHDQVVDKFIPLKPGPKGKKKKGKGGGELRIGIQFVPAGTLTLRPIEGRYLKKVDIGRQDPYIIFSVPGRCFNQKKQTAVDVSGGTEPQWTDTITMDIVDQYELELAVWDRDRIGADDLIGKTTVSLLPYFQKGFIDEWIPVHVRREFAPAAVSARHVAHAFATSLVPQLTRRPSRHFRTDERTGAHARTTARFTSSGTSPGHPGSRTRRGSRRWTRSTSPDGRIALRRRRRRRNRQRRRSCRPSR